MDIDDQGDLDEELEFELEKALSSASADPLLKLTRLNARNRAALAVKEKAIFGLAQFWSKKNDLENLKSLVKSKDLFKQFTKPRTIQVVKRIIDTITKKSWSAAVDAVKLAMEWAKAEKSLYLLPVLKAKLARLYVEGKQLDEAGALIAPLIKEIKKLDDKALLVEIHLSESDYHLELGNIDKAQGALTACRASSSSTWIPRLLTAQIEMASGILSCLNEDFGAAFSYFYEAFEGFDSTEDRRAQQALVYMILSKVVGGKHTEVQGILSSKHTVKYEDAIGIKICQEVAQAAKDSSVKALDNVTEKHRSVIKGDMLMSKSLTTFKESLLKKNVLKVLKAYSRVQVKHVAKKIDLPYELIEKQIVDMILDGDLQGDVDHRNGVVNIYDTPPAVEMYKDAVEIINEMSGVSDELLKKVAALS